MHMRPHFLCRIIFCLCILIFVGTGYIYAELPDTGNEEILFIGSYNADTQYANEFYENFLHDYESLGGKAKLAMEIMNCHSIESRTEWMERMRAILKRHPSAAQIILYGPEAWACYLSLTEPHYREIPLCFIASQRFAARLSDNTIPALAPLSEDSLQHTSPRNQELVDMTELMKDFNTKMCYYYDYAIEDDVNVMLNLRPEVNTILTLSDASFSGYSMLLTIKHLIRERFPKLHQVLVNGCNETVETTSRIISHMDKNTTAGIFCVWRYDALHEIQLSHALESLKLSFGDIPVISLTGSGLEDWCIGGSIPNYNWQDGRKHPADIVYQIIDKKAYPEPYYYSIPNIFRFDNAQMERMGLDIEQLPDNIIITERHSMSFHDFVRSYWKEILAITLLVLVITAGFIATTLLLLRLRRMHARLQESESRLMIENKRLEESERALKASKEEAEKANNIKSLFIRNMTHEFRTPLNSIQGCAELILDDNHPLNNDQRQLMVQMMNKNISQLLTLMKDILTISELDAGIEKLTFEPVFINRLTQQFVDIYRNKLHAGVTISASSELAETFTIGTNETYMHNILGQVISNAVKFTDEGEIRTYTYVQDHKLKISVTDTGIGISPESAEHIFERFYKVDSYTPGTGLGLSICRELCHKLHGEVYLDTTYTAGTRFIVELPLG